MAYIPPVNIPSLGGKDYARDLYGMISGVGEAYYGAKRDTIADQQWAAEQERLNTAQALAQSNADRNYALELRKFEADQAAGAASAGEYFAPQWAFNDQTQEWGLVQPSKTGGAGSLVAMPDGYKPMPPTSNANLGTTIQPVTTRGGMATGAPLPVDLAGAAAAREGGSIQGGAAANLPAARANADYVKQQIDSLMTDPDLALVTGGGGAGGFGGLLPTDFSLWGDTRDRGRAIQSKVDFVKAQVFPIAYDLIRGAGPIAIAESQAAAAAIARLDKQNLSDADYIEALADFKIKLDAMIQAVEAKAAGSQQPAQPQGQTITTPGGRQFQKVGQ